MEHTKYFQSGSKEGEGRVLKYQKIHLQASIFEMLLGLHRGLVICCLYKTHDIFPKWLQRRWKHDPKRTENPCPSLHFKMLLGLGASLGTPWRPSWDGDLKNHQTITFLDFFLEHIYDRCCIFVVTCFAIFSKPHFCQLSGLRGSHAHQFEAHVGTNLMTFPINVEKWRLRFRSREDIKIKLFRVCVSRWFINCWCVLSKPVSATLHRRHYWHYAEFMESFGLHFGLKMAILSIYFV